MQDCSDIFLDRVPNQRALFSLLYSNVVLFSSTEYRILGKKGEGTFSEVLKVQDIRDGTYFACKKMKQRYER